MIAFRRYRGHAAGKYKLDCAFVKSDSAVVCGSEDGQVHGWQLLSNQPIGQLGHQGRRVAHSLCSDHQNLLLSASESHVFVWTVYNFN
jgi:WD40 repeat protein